MKVILTEGDGDMKFGMDDLQTSYYITVGGEQVADFTVGQGVYSLNEHAAFDKVEDKRALTKLISRAFVLLAAKFQSNEPGEPRDSHC